MSAAVSVEADVLPDMIFRQFRGRRMSVRRLIYVAYSRRREIAAIDMALAVPVLVHRPDVALHEALAPHGVGPELVTQVFGLAPTAPGHDIIIALHDRLTDSHPKTIPVLCYSKGAPRGVLVRVPRVEL